MVLTETAAIPTSEVIMVPGSNFATNITRNATTNLAWNQHLAMAFLRPLKSIPDPL